MIVTEKGDFYNIEPEFVWLFDKGGDAQYGSVMNTTVTIISLKPHTQVSDFFHVGGNTAGGGYGVHTLCRITDHHRPALKIVSYSSGKE